MSWCRQRLRTVTVLYGCTPFRGSHRESTFANVLQMDLAFPFTPEVSAASKDLITQLLIRDPVKRLGTAGGAMAIRSHRAFDGVSFELICNLQVRFFLYPSTVF